MSRAAWLLPVLIVALSTACKGSNDTSGLECGTAEQVDVSCHYDGGCIDIVCPDFDDGICYTMDKQKFYDQKGCEARKGRLVRKCSCPKGAVGGCRKVENERTETNWVYKGMTTEEFQNLCESDTRNSWIAP